MDSIFYRPKKKKGQTTVEVLVFFLVLLAFGVVIVFGHSFLDSINDEIQADTDLSNTTRTFFAENDADYTTVWDTAFICLFGGLWLVLLITAFLIDSHPIFFIIAVVLMIIGSMSAVFLSNFFVEMIDDPNLYPELFPMTNFVMNNMLIFFIVVGFSVLLVLYAKQRAA